MHFTFQTNIGPGGGGGRTFFYDNLVNLYDYHRLYADVRMNFGQDCLKITGSINDLVFVPVCVFIRLIIHLWVLIALQILILI